MSDIVSIVPKAHVVIDSGTIIASTDPSLIGEFMFFVEYHDEDGGVVGDYSGRSHSAALEAAREWGVPIFDQTSAGATQ